MEDKKKKSFTILGTSIWRILAYFIIYSFVGFLIETIFALVFYNVLESRQSFLYGPFCGIYGIGAVIMMSTTRRLDDFDVKTISIAAKFLGKYIEE